MTEPNSTSNGSTVHLLTLTTTTTTRAPSQSLLVMCCGRSGVPRWLLDQEADHSLHRWSADARVCHVVVQDAKYCIKCYHAGVCKVTYMCKCGRSNPTNCFLCTPDLLETAEKKRVQNFRGKMVKMARSLRYLISPSQIPNKTLSL